MLSDSVSRYSSDSENCWLLLLSARLDSFVINVEFRLTDDWQYIIMILIFCDRYFVAMNFSGRIPKICHYVCRGDTNLAIFTALWEFYNDFSFIFRRWPQPGQFHSETVRTEYSRVWSATSLTGEGGLFWIFDTWRPQWLCQQCQPCQQWQICQQCQTCQQVSTMLTV